MDIKIFKVILHGTRAPGSVSVKAAWTMALFRDGVDEPTNLFRFADFFLPSSFHLCPSQILSCLVWEKSLAFLLPSENRAVSRAWFSVKNCPRLLSPPLSISLSIGRMSVRRSREREGLTYITHFLLSPTLFLISPSDRSAFRQRSGDS